MGKRAAGSGSQAAAPAPKKTCCDEPNVVVENPDMSSADPVPTESMAAAPGKFTLLDDDAVVDAWPIMKQLIPAVKSQLAAALTAAGCSTTMSRVVYML